jgi:hypothetical protein
MSGDANQLAKDSIEIYNEVSLYIIKDNNRNLIAIIVINQWIIYKKTAELLQELQNENEQETDAYNIFENGECDIFESKLLISSPILKPWNIVLYCLT